MQSSIHAAKQLSEVEAGQARGHQQDAKIVQIIGRITKQSSAIEIIDELTRAELFGELPEFYVLIFRAILGMIEEMDLQFVIYYLDMAEVVATTEHELAIVQEVRVVHDSMSTDVPTTVERCLFSIERHCQICGLTAS
jgi:hypothetical protein